MIDYMFTSVARGIRNNNWLNIKFNSRNQWLGQCGVSDGFCIFKSSEFCFRAARKILFSYLKRNKDLTLEQFISQWSATDRKAYISFVCRTVPYPHRLSRTSRMSTLTDLDIIYLFRQMSIFENGLEYEDYINDHFSDIIIGYRLK